ncbi:hypothetical protein J6590_010504 [Homalodisca vitripennis]|nr:hypothetical protein J6590_010504 [Homalodisca vitripennis]
MDTPVLQRQTMLASSTHSHRPGYVSSLSCKNILCHSYVNHGLACPAATIHARIRRTFAQPRQSTEYARIKRTFAQPRQCK